MKVSKNNSKNNMMRNIPKNLAKNLAIVFGESKYPDFEGENERENDESSHFF